MEVADGPGKGHQATYEASRISVGSHASNDLVVDDPSVSRFHCSLEQTSTGLLLRDLGSRNGTYTRDMRVREVVLTSPTERVAVGDTVLVVTVLEKGAAPANEEDPGFGPIKGSSPCMMRLFRVLERIAATDVTVLLEGETGTGKGLIARALHEASARSAAPFLVVDCASLPPTLIESELFGHERGAFTGASEARPGAFEAARGGTLFLDEIGELPADLQPKFLRAIEDRQIKRIGAATPIPVDVRLLAATNRDLLAEVKAGRFRSDLYYRLDVVKIHVPPLRERAEDIPVLVRAFMAGFPKINPPFEITEDDWAVMKASPWPGNIRELRAAIERAIVLGDKAYLYGNRDRNHGGPPMLVTPAIDRSLPFREAKRRVVDAFEREFVRGLIDETRGNVSEAARRAQMDRNYLRTLIDRHLRAG